MVAQCAEPYKAKKSWEKCIWDERMKLFFRIYKQLSFNITMAYTDNGTDGMSEARLMKRAVWVDWLRLLALFMVVCSHCCDPFTANPDPIVSSDARLGFWGAIWQSLQRPCVPLFACMTGLLLLPVKQDMAAFYKKRIGRVLWPFLIWSALYCLFPVVAMGLGATRETVLSFFVAAGEPSGALSDALADICRIPFDFTGYTTHMWYVFLIIGLYLYLPIFSAWVRKASMQEKYAFLALWAATLFLPYAGLLSEQLFGSCAWNSFGMLYYFAGFSGYMLLGHVAAQKQPLPWGRTLAIAIPCFIVGYICTFVGYRLIQTGAVASGRSLAGMLEMACNPFQSGMSYEQSHELCLLFCSPNVALMVMAFLFVFRKFGAAPLRVRALLANMTACGFGIYLVHYFFVGPSSMLMNALGVPLQLVVPASALLAFPSAWLAVAVLRRLAPAKWFLG